MNTTPNNDRGLPGTRAAAHDALAESLRRHDSTMAHGIIENLCDVIDAIAKQVAEQTAAGILAQRRPGASFVTADGKVHRPGPDCPACTAPSTSPVPSKETEAEKLQSRLVEATERIAHLLEPIAVNAKAIQYASLRSIGYACDDTRRAIQTLTDYQAPPRTERNKP